MSRAVAYSCLMLATLGFVGFVFWLAMRGEWQGACIFSFLAGTSHTFAFVILTDRWRT